MLLVRSHVLVVHTEVARQSADSPQEVRKHSTTVNAWMEYFPRSDAYATDSQRLPTRRGESKLDFEWW